MIKFFEEFTLYSPKTLQPRYVIWILTVQILIWATASARGGTPDQHTDSVLNPQDNRCSNQRDGLVQKSILVLRDTNDADMLHLLRCLAHAGVHRGTKFNNHPSGLLEIQSVNLTTQPFKRCDIHETVHDEAQTLNINVQRHSLKLDPGTMLDYPDPGHVALRLAQGFRKQIGRIL